MGLIGGIVPEDFVSIHLGGEQIDDAGDIAAAAILDQILEILAGHTNHVIGNEHVGQEVGGVGRVLAGKVSLTLEVAVARKVPGHELAGVGLHVGWGSTPGGDIGEGRLDPLFSWVVVSQGGPDAGVVR